MRKPSLIIIIGLILGAVQAATTGSFEDGDGAFRSRDYATAFKLWRPLAEQGDARAQYRVGALFYYGQGVTENRKEAVLWYRLAAEQGYVQAQNSLLTRKQLGCIGCS